MSSKFAGVDFHVARAAFLRCARAVPSSRFDFLLALLLAFLACNALVRLGLAGFSVFQSADPGVLAPWTLLPALLIGALFDVSALAYVLPVFAALLAVWPARATRSLRLCMAVLLLLTAVVWVFVAASEFTFWNEFSSRFNFIAVDYLIYTNEVIGNIRESYDLPKLLSGVALASLLLWWGLCRACLPPLARPLPRGPWRWFAVLAVGLLPAMGFWAVDARYKEFSANGLATELAGNGYFDFWHAFRTNEIDYERFYKTIPVQRAQAELALELNGHRPLVTLSQRPFDRQITARGAARPLNVVLVSVESFSAEFMQAFGNRQGLTPSIDQLAREGLLFTHLYATGTRTVRGLEALTLSVPPTPGHSIVKRPDNANLFTLGEVFKEKGYEPIYLYGGYSYFDNMNAFFSGNGYTVIDRSALAAPDISFENIWGVADEDLFGLTLRELDQRHARGQKFFAHVMTTSNHRPFTYPPGRIDIPSRSGREGGVKYTDYAIGRFIAQARAKPWFDDTVFVIVADHTHIGRGKQNLPLATYHIPMVIYSPKHVVPGRVDSIASQIDVAPTLLGLLNFSYRSRFFGQDILREGQEHQRALMANYQTVGYYESGVMVELKPNGRYRIVDAATGELRPEDALSSELLDEAISYYQIASSAYRRGELKLGLRN